MNIVYPKSAKIYYNETPLAEFSVLAESIMKILKLEPINSPPI